MSQQENECRVDTCCGPCVFAEYDADTKMQVGCGANVLSRITKEHELVQMGDYKCFQIVGFTCPFWRPSGWLHQFAEPAEGEEFNVQELVARARQEITLRADLIIYCDKDTTMDDLDKTATSIKAMTLKPYRIFIANDNMTAPLRLLDWAREHLDIPWRIESILVEYDNKLKANDAVVDKCKSMFISVFRAGFAIPKDFLTCIDKALYDNLDKFVYLSSIDGINGLTMMRQLYETLRGNKYGPLEEQVQELCQLQKCQNLMKSVTEIVPSMQA